MKSIVPSAVICCVLWASTPLTHASKLKDWINNHAVPRAPSSNKINGAADQTKATAAETQKTINQIGPKLDTLCDVLTWGGGAVLGLLGLMLIGENVAIWRHALAKRQQSQGTDQRTRAP
jgi:hypothetical protein